MERACLWRSSSSTSSFLDDLPFILLLFDPTISLESFFVMQMKFPILEPGNTAVVEA